MPIMVFAIHGNHEQRPQNIEGHQEKVWHGGVVYQKEEYPSLLFAKDGEVFDLDGKQAIVMGGAYSIDKMVWLMYGYGWWPDEQPSEEIKRYVESRLDRLGWKVDVVLSHTRRWSMSQWRCSWLGLTRVRWTSLRRIGWIMGSGIAGIIIRRRRLIGGR